MSPRFEPGHMRNGGGIFPNQLTPYTCRNCGAKGESVCRNRTTCDKCQPIMARKRANAANARKSAKKKKKGA